MTAKTTEPTRRATLAAIARVPKDRRKAVACALVGHSLMQSAFFGYYSCGRCGEQVGDTLDSCYPTAERCVVKGHGCDTCKKNAAALTWKDRLLMPSPSKWMAQEVKVSK